MVLIAPLVWVVISAFCVVAAPIVAIRWAWKNTLEDRWIHWRGEAEKRSYEKYMRKVRGMPEPKQHGFWTLIKAYFKAKKAKWCPIEEIT